MTKELTVVTNSVFDLIPMTDEERAMLQRDACGENLEGLDILGLQTPILKICNDKGDRLGKFVHGFNEVDCWPVLDGILIKTKSRRAYWPNPLDPDNPEPPACRSENGVTCSDCAEELEGIQPGQMCSKCPLSQWTKSSSGDDVPPPCTLFMDMLYYLKPEGENSDPFVAQITSSPTSLKYIRKYLNAIRWSGKPSYAAHSRLEIGVDEKGKMSWYVLKPHFQLSKPVSKEDALAIKPFLFKKAEEVFNNDESVLYNAAASDIDGTSGSSSDDPWSNQAGDKIADAEFIPADQPVQKPETQVKQALEKAIEPILDAAEKSGVSNKEISATLTLTPETSDAPHPADVDDECPF